jgi:hypothetical protein
MKFRKESPNALRWRFEVGSVCTFTATKSRENMTGTVRRVCRNVNRWRNAAMALRWPAAGMMEAAKGFRPIESLQAPARSQSCACSSSTPNELNTNADAA